MCKFSKILKVSGKTNRFSGEGKEDESLFPVRFLRSDYVIALVASTVKW